MANSRKLLKTIIRSMLAAAHNQVISTHYRRANIEKDGLSPLYEKCKKAIRLSVK